MKVFPSVLLPLAALLACCLLLTAAAAPDAGCSTQHKKLGASFSDFTVPKRAKATVGESLGFAAIVVGVLAVASVNTFFKVGQSVSPVVSSLWCGLKHKLVMVTSLLTYIHSHNHHHHHYLLISQLKASPKLPGYTQAVYLRERDHS